MRTGRQHCGNIEGREITLKGTEMLVKIMENTRVTTANLCICCLNGMQWLFKTA